MAIFQIFIKLLDGRTQCLQISSPTISGLSLKQNLQTKTKIPLQSLRLVSGSREISNESLISASEDNLFPSCNLLLRLRGGKGGFGSLLRGAATKAGQKKTNNFDACRDMSGRRLRHVNAEKKLEEWKAEAEERKLEKVAEDFLKKKAKAVRKKGSADTEKYIEKYREDSAKCMEEVEASVRQSFGLYEDSKRKVLPSSGPASKRLKIWLGKGKELESDDSDDDEEDGEEDEKSVVLDDANCLVQNKLDEGTSGSVSGGQSDGESSGGASSHSNLDNENGIFDQGGLEIGEGCGSRAIHADAIGSAEPESGVCNEGCLKLEESSKSGTVNGDLDGPVEPESRICSQEVLDLGEGSGSVAINAVEGRSSSIESKSGNSEEISVQDTTVSNLDGPLKFDEFSTATELEVLGMERLKAELQVHGLKCGGTLQERAARLFLLKTTPIEMLPKKLFATKPKAA
ncbi:ubiquitin-like superfamily protein [Tasmannia lanceolata]|uniref:ubiquitin-like superfamily protein n=1 Tax=Tasmannia lanceolata TaxID=3420 RepID=UPI004064585A